MIEVFLFDNITNGNISPISMNLSRGLIMKTNTNIFEREKPSIFKMTWPIFIELFLEILVMYVDQWMISHYSNNSVGAIGNANQILSVLVLTFSIISSATAILVSQYLGANNKQKVSEIYSLAIAVNTAFSIVISVFLVLFNEKIFYWMNIPAAMKSDFQTYISIIGGFMFLQAIFMTFVAIFRSNALMKDTMFLAIIINVINVIGNALLIYGIGPFPELGIVGVGISTNVSKLIGVILICILYKKRIGIKISLKKLKPFPIATFKKLLSIGIPSGGEAISYTFTQIVILFFVNHFGETVINTRIFSAMFALLVSLFTQAIGSSTQVLVGYQIGAKEPEKANKQVWETLFMSIIISVGFTIIIFIFSDFFFGIFSHNIDVLSLGKKILFVEIFLEFGRSTNIVMVRSLQATGDIKFPVTLGIISNWTISVILSYVFGILLGWGLVGIWIAMACDEIFRAIVFIFRWKSGVWKNKSLIKE